MAFTSTSTVYGEAHLLPTPEDYAPLLPISLYGASKLACESLISAWCHTFRMNAIIYRFANCVGPRGTHGVIIDFINKLKANPRELEILGDGTQRKSYLYITDCVEAMIYALEHTSFDIATQRGGVEVYNIGSEDHIDVKSIADIVTSSMGLRDVKYTFTGGVNGGRGWLGDVKFMFLSIDKLRSLGWKPKYNSSESIRLAVQALLEDMNIKKSHAKTKSTQGN
jgi:UDP-glucose 4-epimerase